MKRFRGATVGRCMMVLITDEERLSLGGITMVDDAAILFSSSVATCGRSFPLAIASWLCSLADQV